MSRLTTLSRSVAGQVVIVTGAASGMGRATAHLLADEGAAVGIVDRNAEGLARVHEEIAAAGARVHAVTADVAQEGAPEKAVEEIKRITRGGADFTLEMTASPRILRQAVDALQVGGMCGVIGVPSRGTEVSLEMTALLFGRGVRGIRQGESVSDSFIPQLIELYLQGRFPFDRLIEFFSFDQIDQAVKDTESGVAIKPVLRMPQ